MALALGVRPACGNGPSIVADKQIATPIFPTGDEHVRWIRIVDVPGLGHRGVTATVAADDSIYLAGDTYSKGVGTELWVWRVSFDGKLIWKTHLARPEVAEEVQVLRLLANEQELGKSQGGTGGGVCVIFKQGLGFQTRLKHLDADGDVLREHSLGKLGDAHGVAPLANGELVVFGSGRMAKGQSRAWVARVDRAGALQWKQTFDPAPVEDKNGKLNDFRPRGFYEGDLLGSAAELDDGSIALAGQTGIYNKFGQGVSKLWLLRLSGTGEKLAEVFIDDGRVFSKGANMAGCDDGVIVSFTRSQLPPIGGAPNNAPPRVDTTLARFDAHFTQLWEQQLPMSFMPGAATIDGARPYVTLSAWPGTLVIRAADKNGEEHWRSVVNAPEASLLPLATLRVGDEFVAVCSYRSHVRGARRDQTLLVGLRPPVE